MIFGVLLYSFWKNSPVFCQETLEAQFSRGILFPSYVEYRPLGIEIICCQEIAEFEFTTFVAQGFFSINFALSFEVITNLVNLLSGAYL